MIILYDLKRINSTSWPSQKILIDYRDKIYKKKAFVEGQGCKFKFIYQKLTAEQTEYVKNNSRDFL